jgi:hypothetical protein
MKKRLLFTGMLASVLTFGMTFTACGPDTRAAAVYREAAEIDAVTPVITGPITGGEHGWPFGAYFGGIDELGYIEEEYFIEGTARHYVPIGKLAKDGKWALEAVSAVPYKTRFIVRRPAESAKFNGTVVLEWANVSAGFEMSLLDSPGLYYEGFAYIAVSAQRNGLYGFEEKPQGLIPWDLERYGSLSIPDDGLSYDIFTQVARAIGKDRSKDGVDPMGGLDVEKLFAVGASQSGSRILSYANGVQPIENVFDAVIPIVNAGRGTDFETAVSHVKKDGKTKVRNVSAKVREDINCKVFVINSQTEAIALGGLAQRDTENICSWQVAGASHLPPHFMETIYLRINRDGLTDAIPRKEASGPPALDWPYVYEAALVSTQNWIDKGVKPPSIEPLAAINMLFGYRKDIFGNMKGGVRLPELEVPVAKYETSIWKGLGVEITPFSREELLRLYPSHEDYVDKIRAAAARAAQIGVILPYRAEEYVREAEASAIPVSLGG